MRALASWVVGIVLVASIATGNAQPSAPTALRVLAFDGGAFGVNILMRLLQDAPRFIKPGGWLAFEVGLGQGPAMAKRLEKAGHFSDLRLEKDENGAPRALAARFNK